jgi:hypothetical protein
MENGELLGKCRMQDVELIENGELKIGEAILNP